MSLIVSALAFVGNIVATLGSAGSFIGFMDEPTCPKCLIEK